MQKLLTTVILILIVYAIVKEKFFYSPTKYVNTETIQEKSSEKKQEEFEGGVFTRFISKVVSNVLKTEQGQTVFMRMIGPVSDKTLNLDSVVKLSESNLINRIFNIYTIKEGEGSTAYCGDTVNISYKITNLEGEVIEKSTNKIITLGQKQSLPAIENVVVGMKVNEQRGAISSNIYAYDVEGFSKANVPKGTTIKLEIILNKIIDSSNKDLVYVFDDYLAYKIPYMCGDLVECNMKIKDVYNNTLYEGQLSIQLGDKKFPLVLSRILFGKIPVGNRIAVTSSQYLKDLVLQGLNIKDHEFLLIEFDNFTEKPIQNLLK